MISQTKSGYRRDHPDHVVIYNAALADDDGVHLWSGDLDLTVDEAKLQALATALEATIHVLYESDAWPIGDDAPGALDLRRAVLRVSPAGETSITGGAARDAAGKLILARRAEQA